METVSNINKMVMRRVYYSYTLSIFEHTMFWQGVVLGACIAAFGRLTHVASIFHNISLVPVGNLPRFIEGSFVNALAQGEVLTVLVVVAMTGLSVSFIARIMPMLVTQRMVA